MSETLSIPWPGGRLTLRPETPADLLFRFDLFCKSRAPEWSQVALPDDVRAQIMHHQFDAQTRSYASQFSKARFDIVELDGRPIGRIIVDYGPDEFHLVDQAIMPEHRNRGIGTAIMTDLIANARAAGLPITLMVADDNDPSKRLYDRLGFVTTKTEPVYLAMAWRP